MVSQSFLHTKESVKETIITPNRSFLDRVIELWESRKIFIFLGLRDIVILYRQTVIGVLWVVLRPLLVTVVFTIIFSKIAGIIISIPYSLVVLSGMLVWQFFLDMIQFSGNSFLVNSYTISKMYIPRLLFPASRLLCCVLNFILVLAVYICISWFRYGYAISWKIIWMIPYLVWLTVFSFAIAVLCSSLTIRYRDFLHIVPFVMQFSMYCTPVVFVLDMIPKSIRLICAINPLTGIIEGMRWILLNQIFSWQIFFISLISTMLITWASLYYFFLIEETMVDDL